MRNDFDRFWCLVSASVALAVACMVSGCGERGFDPAEFRLMDCRKSTFVDNIVAVSNGVERICRSGGEDLRRNAKFLADAVVVVPLCEVTAENDPRYVLRTYEKIVFRSARLMRDRFPPDIVVGMLFDARARLLRERELVEPRTRQWCRLIQGTPYEVGRNRGLKLPEWMRDKLAESESRVQSKNNLHDLDDGILVDFKEFIELRALPYCLYKRGCDTNTANALIERFSTTFGHRPTRHTLNWR